ncbi:hypothetical protein CAEBREN_02708 [Caenorhabditis brenneri]|uniref:Ubiquitin-like domain-containing protein n=1 Tax=Caenorhabditis brenneri TaxID=135651 RepID=G0PG18_CAEBE|nr:hypothetical protein CAEBREN_02708 [Caenorhabditis brenneri]
MLIKVKTFTGKVFELDIESDDKVEKIKNKVEKKVGIPTAQQRLYFAGQPMNDDKTAADYKVVGGSVIYVELRLRGAPSWGL